METRQVLRRLLRFPYQLFVILFFFPLVVFWGLGSCAASLFDPDGNRAHRCLIYWARASLALARLRVEIRGLENLDPGETYIFMPNHSSFLDILLAFACIPYNFRIITKEEVFRIPFMGWALKRSRQIPMDRANPRRGLASLRQASNWLRKEISIVVFPEGTRTSNGKINEFKPTLFILPIRTGIPVVPVLIEGTFEALRRGTVLLNPVPLKLTFHSPVSPGSFKDRDRWVYAKKVREILLASSFR